MYNFKRKRFPDERRGAWVAVGVAAVGVVGGVISRSKANKKARKLQEEAERNKYTANPLAQQRLDLANSLLNARMPGAAQAERNIQSSTANASGSIQRNASSGSQALALNAASQGQENNAFSNLGLAEAQDYQRRYANQENAIQGVINEGDKVQAGTQNLIQQKGQIQGAIAANNANTWSSITNLGMSAANFGMNGGFNSGAGQSFWGSGGGSSSGNQWQMPHNQYNPQTLPYRNP